MLTQSVLTVSIDRASGTVRLLRLRLLHGVESLRKLFPFGVLYCYFDVIAARQSDLHRNILAFSFALMDRSLLRA
jgi:hypothetical protein